MRLKKKSNNKLKPCPFCGSDAELKEIVFGQLAVVCSTCGASSDWYSGSEAGQACNAWNMRSYDKNVQLVYVLSIMLSTSVLSISVISFICRCLGYL